MLHFHPTSSIPPARRGGGGADLDPTLLDAPVLIVEDEAMIAWTMESLLEELGFTRISIAPSGELAIAQARRVAPRLIVSDINLGPQRMDGIAAACAILTEAAAGVVFVTGHASDEARARIEGAIPGAVVLAKPVASPELARAISAAAGRVH